jgi:hypothetical protein
LRSKHRVVQGEQRVIARKRADVEDVESSAIDPALLQRPKQSGTVDQARAGGGEEERRPHHRSQVVDPDDLVGRWAEFDLQGHDVRGAGHSRLRHGVGPETLTPLGIRVEAPRDHLYAERPADLGHARAAAAKSSDVQSPLVGLLPERSRPPAGAHALLLQWDVLPCRQYQSRCEPGGLRGVALRPDHLHTDCSRSSDIDPASLASGHGFEMETGQWLQDRARDAGPFTHEDYGVQRRDPADQEPLIGDVVVQEDELSPLLERASFSDLPRDALPFVEDRDPRSGSSRAFLILPGAPARACVSTLRGAAARP